MSLFDHVEQTSGELECKQATQMLCENVFFRLGLGNTNAIWAF